MSMLYFNNSQRKFLAPEAKLCSFVHCLSQVVLGFCDGCGGIGKTNKSCCKISGVTALNTLLDIPCRSRLLSSLRTLPDARIEDIPLQLQGPVEVKPAFDCPSNGKPSPVVLKNIYEGPSTSPATLTPDPPAELLNCNQKFELLFTFSSPTVLIF
eukprot:1157388-Pelagomonas_calceolata.AAC.23